jgi:PAS domain S-box-containing protein
MGRWRETSDDLPEARRRVPVAGLTLLAVCAVLYPIVAAETGRPLAAFALPALLVATTRGPRTTAFIGGLCAVAAVTAAVLDHGRPDQIEVVRLLVVLAAIALGIAGAAARHVRETALTAARTRSDELGARLRSVSQALRAGRIGTWWWDGATGRVHWDDDLQQLYGIERGSFAGTFEAWLELVHPDDRRYSVELIETSRRTGAEFTFEHRCTWPDGSTHWLAGVGQPVRDDTGRITGAVGVTANIDDRHAADEERRRVLELERRARDRSAYLASASQALVSSLDVEELVERIAAAAVPTLADWCRFTVILDDGEVRVRTAIAHPDAELVELTRWLETQQPFRPDAPFGAAKVIAEGTTIFHPTIERAQIDAILEHADVGRVVAQLGMRSAITVPVRNPTGTVGALQLVRLGDDSPPYTELDVGVAEELATTIGVALHNAQLFRRQREARRLLDILQQLSGRLALAVTVDDVADAAITQGANALGADEAHFYLLDDDRLEPARHVGQAGHAGHAGDADLRVLKLHERTPATDALRDDRVVVIGSAADMAAQYPDLHARSVAMIAVPLRIRRVRAGAVVFGFGRPRSFTDEEQAMLSTFAARCAGAVERAQLYEAQRDASLMLQRRMLPALPPDEPWVQTSAHYHPATGGEVGGDWYQVIVLDEHRIAAVLGDAVGRGIPAAAAMGQLRGVVTGAASVDPDPRRVITATDRFARTGADTNAASLLYVLVDRRAAELRYSSAGHLPGIVLRHDGSVDLLRDGRRPLLGVLGDQVDGPVGTTSFEVGDAVVLYSDGLVERRDETIDAGIDRLVELLARCGPDTEPASLCTEIIEVLTGARTITDDVAVLVVRRTA